MEIGTVRIVDIDHEMRSAYLDYAMSVITARALPDVRDGLKPVQRRILYAMNELGITHASAYKKSARIVGEVLGKYHPHGDAPVYETMVRMAQDFSMRYVLVDGQGNFGSVDGDPPAAMRYTEARLAAVAEEILVDLDKNTVDFTDNFDGTLKEPSVLPARLPNLLLNGATGIAVGMATNIPPHNLREVADALIFILDQFQRAVDGGVPFEIAQTRVHGRPVDHDTILGLRKGLSADLKALLAQSYADKVAALEKAPKTREQKDEIEHDALIDVIDDIVDVPVERLMEFIVGPDFPTGGIIIGRKGIIDAYTTGHGRIVIRAKVFVEARGGDRSTIIITELPYQVNKATLVERIADLVRDKRIEGVSELRDESDRQGMRVVIELRRDVAVKQILNNLFKLTPMQSAFSVNLLALVDGEPRVLNIKRLLQHYIDYRNQVIIRRIQFDLDKARARAHILEGLKIALDNLDEVISTIRNSPDAEVARTRLMKRFKLSELQAQAILDMQLRRLAALERKKIEQELAETLKLIAQWEDLLAHPIKIYGLIKEDLVQLKEKFGDDRRTAIRDEEAEDFTAEDLIPDEDVMVAISSRSYIKRVPADAYRAQPRRSPARAVTAVVSKEQDPLTLLVSANTHDIIIFLSNLGKAYAMKGHEIPAGDRGTRGVPINNFLSTAPADERIVGMLATREQNGTSITMITRQGDMKRISVADMAGLRASGVNVMALAPQDEVVWAGPTQPGDEIIIVTAQGKSIRFEPETEARASGRGSGGVRAIKLDADDSVIAVDIVDKDGALLVLTSLGLGKRTDMGEYSPQGRGGGGVMTAAISPKTGPLVAARVMAAGDDVLIISALGSVVRKPFEEIIAQGRAGRSARLIELEKDDRPTAILRLRPEKKPAAEPPTTEPAPKRKKAAAKPEDATTPDDGQPVDEPKPRGKKVTPIAEAKKAEVAPPADGKAGPKPRNRKPALEAETLKATELTAPPIEAAPESGTKERPAAGVEAVAPGTRSARKLATGPTPESALEKPVAEAKKATPEKTSGSAVEAKLTPTTAAQGTVAPAPTTQAAPVPTTKATPAPTTKTAPAAEPAKAAPAPMAKTTPAPTAKAAPVAEPAKAAPAPTAKVAPAPLTKATPAPTTRATPAPAAKAGSVKEQNVTLSPSALKGLEKAGVHSEPPAPSPRPGAKRSTPEPVVRPEALARAAKAATGPASAPPKGETKSPATKAAPVEAVKPAPGTSKAQVKPSVATPPTASPAKGRQPRAEEPPATRPARPKRPGKDDIVIRTGGKITVVPRSEIIPGEQHKVDESQRAKKSKGKGVSQFSLPLWGDDLGKKK
jgi:DNA gyrase subunit A